MIPYATPADRARALYRIPTAPQPNRTLEVCRAREPLLADAAWPGDGHRSWLIGEGARAAAEPPPFAPQSFDLVILHRTLDDLAAARAGFSARFDAPAFLQSLVPLLAPGGLLAGCVDNLNHPRQRLGRGGAWLTPRSLRRLLLRAGLADVRLFTLQPSCDAPMKIVETDAAVSRHAFRRELETERRYMGRGAWLLRRVAIELGLNRHVESALFFWGARPC